MTWSLQLTFWALPPLLALLLVLRDATFLWPRRREAGTRALLALAASVGVWAVLDLVSAVTPSLEAKLVAAQAENVPAAAATVAWAWFALAYLRREPELRRWPMGLLYLGSLAVTVATLTHGGGAFLVTGGSLAPVGGAVGLEASHGVGHWLFLLVRSGVVVVATSMISHHLAGIHGQRRRTAYAGLAGLAALVPPLAPPLLHPGAEWMDLSSTGFAVACALLVWGLMRPQILNLGPVDREVVLRELRDPLVVMDGRGQIVDANQAARDELGLIPYGVVPVTLGTLWAKATGPDGIPPTRVVLDEEEGPVDEESRIYEVTFTPLGRDKERRSALLLRDVTESERTQRLLREANVELERLARTDPLTGLANRRHFMEELESEVERAQRYGRPLSVVLLDLDHFKRVNDTYGHAAGDDVLRGAARALKSVCRDVDVAARLGGEELALILPETDVVGARTVAERVRERIAGQSHTAPSGERFTVTASLGVATARDDTRTGEDLLHASDEALYKAKDDGRNRVVTAR